MPDLYKMRVIYEVLGGHTHIQIFTGKDGFGLGKSGELCMTNEEFTAWRQGLCLMEFGEYKA